MIPTFITKDGEIYLNDLRRYAKGTILVPTSANSPITTAASSDSPPIAIEGPQDAVSEIFSLMVTHGASDDADVQAKLAVMIRDIAYRRDLMNRHILVNHVFGTGQRPGRLHESILLENQQTITFEFRNGSAAGSSTIKIATEARTFQGFGIAHPYVVSWLREMRLRKAYLSPYWMTSDNTITPAAGATVDALFTNTSDKFLLLCEIMASTVDSGQSGDESTEKFAFELWDAKTERKLMNQPVTMNTGTGTAQYPFRLDDPILVEPSTVLRGRFRNLVTDAALSIYFTFAGVQCLADPATFAPGQLVPPNAAGMTMGRF